MTTICGVRANKWRIFDHLFVQFIEREVWIDLGSYLLQSCVCGPDCPYL
jgi:hypothetical protein